ncbi:MAG: Ig-like domain-containing protein [Polyangiales bacterium]
MKSCLSAIAMLATVAAVACSGARPPVPCPEAKPPKAHFVDSDGNTLEQYDAIWVWLSRVYGQAGPTPIRITFRGRGDSMFQVATSSMDLSLQPLDGRSPRATIAHEASHLFLAQLTKRASELEEFRFVDEGLASVLEHELDGPSTAFRKSALGGAALRLHEAKYGFARVQRWSTFFGVDRDRDWGAYDVGASFVYFVRERYGEPALFKLLSTIGETRALGTAIARALGASMDDVEAGWLAYVEKAGYSAPRIVAENPVDGDTAVPVDRSEISVTFDSDMSPTICVVTPCKEGICFDHASFRDPRTLVIKIDKPLLPAHDYHLALGVRSCRLRGTDGRELPITNWGFETK